MSSITDTLEIDGRPCSWSKNEPESVDPRKNARDNADHSKMAPAGSCPANQANASSRPPKISTVLSKREEAFQSLILRPLVYVPGHIIDHVSSNLYENANEFSRGDNAATFLVSYAVYEQSPLIRRMLVQTACPFIVERQVTTCMKTFTSGAFCKLYRALFPAECDCFEFIVFKNGELCMADHVQETLDHVQQTLISSFGSIRDTADGYYWNNFDEQRLNRETDTYDEALSKAASAVLAYCELYFPPSHRVRLT
eukprot:jgi/Mesvir1/26543/Mv16198-RA.1